MLECTIYTSQDNQKLTDGSNKKTKQRDSTIIESKNLGAVLASRAVTIRLSSDTIHIAIQAMRYDTHHDISTLAYTTATSTSINFVLNQFKNCMFSSVLLNIYTF